MSHLSNFEFTQRALNGGSASPLPVSKAQRQRCWNVYETGGNWCCQHLKAMKWKRRVTFVRLLALCVFFTLVYKVTKFRRIPDIPERQPTPAESYRKFYLTWRNYTCSDPGLYCTDYRPYKPLLTPEVPKRKLDFVFVILTHYGKLAAQRRRIIRETWGNKENMAGLQGERVFTAGKW